MLSLFCSFENSVIEKTQTVWLKKFFFLCSAHMVFGMSDKKIFKKIFTQERKEKLGKTNKIVPKQVEEEAC